MYKLTEKIEFKSICQFRMKNLIIFNYMKLVTESNKSETANDINCIFNINTNHLNTYSHFFYLNCFYLYTYGCVFLGRMSNQQQ